MGGCVSKGVSIREGTSILPKELLETIPWWRWASLDNNWSETYETVRGFTEPPLRATREYEWMRTQRKAYKSGSLTSDRQLMLEAIPWWEWMERESTRDKGLELLKSAIEDGKKQGRTKIEVRSSWANLLGIGEDQVHKYLRQLPEEDREKWDLLGDARGRHER